MSNDSYMVQNYVVEFRVRGGEWLTWPAVDPRQMPDEEAARKMFVVALATRHNPAVMQFRLVNRTAMITDEVLDEEVAAGDHEWRSPDAGPGSSGPQ